MLDNLSIVCYSKYTIYIYQYRLPIKGCRIMKQLKRKFKTLDELPAVMTVDDVMDILRISKANAYKVMASEGFPTLRIGKRVLAEKTAFTSWLRGLTL